MVDADSDGYSSPRSPLASPPVSDDDGSPPAAERSRADAGESLADRRWAACAGMLATVVLKPQAGLMPPTTKRDTYETRTVLRRLRSTLVHEDCLRAHPLSAVASIADAPGAG